MPRKPFSKQSSQTVSINVRDVSKHLHLYMRQEALARECSLGQLYDEAIEVFRAQKKQSQAV